MLVREQWFCDFLREKTNELRRVVDEECQEKAAYLMCKSFADAFLNIFPRELENCQVDCPLTAPLETPPPVIGGVAIVGRGGEQKAQEATNMGAQGSGGKTTLRRTGGGFVVLVYLFTASSLAARLIM
uniref:Uncharacterized protein n=1 Tax=Romanomermis culicivorax TaxID=13658 RepID=A0A915I0B5_ROMCU